MSETKWTPGPWAWAYIGDKHNGYIVGTAFDSDGNQLTGLLDSDELFDDIEFTEFVGEKDAATCNYSNAHLIAAAPELYEALDELVDLAGSYASEFGADDAIAEARRALSKARGEA